jgi:hypothetical protein
VGRRTTIAEAALAVLAQRGPLELEELARLVAEQGVTRASRPAVSVRRAIERDPRLALLPDDRWVSVPATLDGAVFTHRLDAEEVATESLAVDPDLAPLDPLTIRSLPLAPVGCSSSARRGSCTALLAGSAA